MSHARIASLVLAAVVAVGATGCGLRDVLTRAAPSAAPDLYARDLTVRIVRGTAVDAQEEQRVASIHLSLSQGLPSAWRRATQGLGRLAVSADRGDIEITLVGTPGQSVFTQQRRGGQVAGRSIKIHTIWAERRLSDGELMFVALHELGHIWCCYSAGTSHGHWTEGPQGLMNSVAQCEWIAAGEVACGASFSERELVEMGLLGRR